MQMADALRIGCIGCGGNGRWHLRTLAGLPDVKVVGLADTSPAMLELARKAAAPLAAAPAFADYRDLIRKVEMDGVLISTPHTLHFRHISDCLSAGLHVLAEKPLACSVAEAKKLAAQARAAKRQIVVSFQRRFMAMRKFVRNHVRDPSFGKPVFVQAFVSQAWPQFTKGTWRQRPKLAGGGQINDPGAHIVDMIHWTLPSRPVEVTAMMHNRGTGVDVDSAVAFHCSDGCVGSPAVLGDGPLNVFWEDMTIAGAKGQAVFLRQGAVTISTGTEIAEYKNFGNDLAPDAHFVAVDLLILSSPQMANLQEGVPVFERHGG